MPNSRPALDVWDSCCIIGILNAEKDKLQAVVAQGRFFGTGSAILGIASRGVSEVSSLADGTSASSKIEEFLDNPYVQLLQPTREVSTMSAKLQFRFNSKQIPDLKDRAIAAGVPKDRASKLTSRDSEVLATAIFYKADRLSTYDPFLIVLGREYIQKATGLVIDPPTSPFLPFPDEGEETK